MTVCAGCNTSSGPHSVPPGTVTGTVASTRGGGISNAHVVVTPAGGTATPTVSTNGAGAYTVNGVTVGSGHGTVVVSGLPSYCETTDSASYANLASGRSLTVNVTVPCAFSMSGAVLWINDQGGFLYGLSAAQLDSTGSPTPTGISTGGYSYAVAFDSHGNMWVGATTAGVVPATAFLYEYTPAQIAGGGANLTPTVSIQLPPVGGSFGGSYQPGSIVFDGNGTLWVNSFDSNILYGYSASQLTTSGATTPAHTVMPYGPSSFNGMAFDRSGNLWMGVYDPPNANKLIALSASQLSAGGTVTPIDSMVFGDGPTPSTIIEGAGSIAFDTSGNLWATGGNALVMFSRASLATLSSSTVTLTPSAVATVPGVPTGVALDGLGNLWVVTEANQPNPANLLLRFPAATLVAGGQLSADITIATEFDSLHDLLSEGFGLAFAPGNGQPLYESKRH